MKSSTQLPSLSFLLPSGHRDGTSKEFRLSVIMVPLVALMGGAGIRVRFRTRIAIVESSKRTLLFGFVESFDLGPFRRFFLISVTLLWRMSSMCSPRILRRLVMFLTKTQQCPIRSPFFDSIGTIRHFIRSLFICGIVKAISSMYTNMMFKFGCILFKGM